jgi:hypothetical protein
MEELANFKMQLNDLSYTVKDCNSKLNLIVDGW